MYYREVNWKYLSIDTIPNHVELKKRYNAILKRIINISRMPFSDNPRVNKFREVEMQVEYEKFRLVKSELEII